MLSVKRMSTFSTALMISPTRCPLSSYHTLVSDQSPTPFDKIVKSNRHVPLCRKNQLGLKVLMNFTCQGTRFAYIRPYVCLQGVEEGVVCARVPLLRPLCAQNPLDLTMNWKIPPMRPEDHTPASVEAVTTRSMTKILWYLSGRVR
jgi:hypothetical protein